jgi:hypothetical protein
LVVGSVVGLACQRGGGESREVPPDKVAAAKERAPVAGEMARWTFEEVEVGGVPAGFQLAQTNGAGQPATWAVVDDATAPSAPRAFGVTEARNDGQFNLAIASSGPQLADVDIQVMLRAVGGERDQGGGVMFRVAGPDDYYVARWNPLEDNARFYIVQGGARSALAKADLELEPQAWHAMRVVMEGKRMELFVDDEPVLTVEDASLTEPGHLGLWTKTDATTLFDELSFARP